MDPELERLVNTLLKRQRFNIELPTIQFSFNAWAVIAHEIYEAGKAEGRRQVRGGFEDKPAKPAPAAGDDRFNWMEFNSFAPTGPEPEPPVVLIVPKGSHE